MPHARFVALGVSVVVAVAAGRTCAAASLPPHVAEYLKAHCGTCHGADKAKAGFRIDGLGGDFTAPAVAERWKEALDRIHAGEMPPDDAPRPDSKRTAEFLAWATAQLRGVEQAARAAGGRTPMRRLNRDEYADTVRDLLKLDERIVGPLVEDLPADGTAEGFDRLGAALFFDQTQIERSLDVAAKIAARTLVDAPPKAKTQLNTFPFLRARPPADRVEVFPSSKHKIPRGARDRVVHPEFVEHLQGYPTYRRDYDGWGVIDHFSVRDTVVQDGYYRVRVDATVDDRGRTEPNKFRLQYGMDSPIQVEHEMTLDPSGLTEAVLFLRGPVNGEVKGPQVLRLLWNHTEKCVIMEPTYNKAFFHRVGLASQLERAASARAPQAEQDELRKQLDEAIAKLEAWTGPAYVFNPAMDIERLPRLRIKSIEISGPVEKEWPPASRRALLFGGDERQDEAYVREVFARFLPRAYRRPATPAEVDAAVEVVRRARAESKQTFLEAMRTGLQWVLCSPGFLFLNEPTGERTTPRPLDAYERASRLSYFLWSTMPDEELFAAAAAGTLTDPASVRRQVERMLDDPKAERFVRNFAGQWLGVREYGAVQPAAEYRDYDKPLEAAAKREPLEFFAEVLRRDLPITAFLDSDFVVINERLARHYGIEGVRGPEFRNTAIRPEHHRGGVLGMAGLMTYLADGTRTLPMRRGTWVLRELFHDPPNDPPPNAGEIQPNTAGKNLTLRERLERHRRDDVCASCHAKLDPFGLALENYDAIGAWRERFNGEGFRGNNGPKLDVGGTFPDGRKFATLEEYKAGLMADRDKFARAFTIKLLTYALGRPIGFADETTVGRLVAELKAQDYRLRALVQGIAASEEFNVK